MINKQKILLIAPSPPEERKDRVDPPLGLAYIASGLEERGHEVKILDMNIDGSDVVKEIETFQPSIAGIQVMTQHRFFVFNLTKIIKKEFPEVMIVLGGPHVTFTAHEVLEKVKSIDVIVKGEGENAMCKIADGESFSIIQGISFRKGNTAVHNPLPPPFDVNELPVPAYHLLNLKKYNLDVMGEPATAIFTSRGCPNKCIFCSSGHMPGGLRFKNPEIVLETVKKLKNDFGYNAFIIEDDTFGANYEVTRKIMEGFKSMEITVGIKTRANLLKPGFLRMLKSGGCVRLNFGVESGEPRILKVIRKNIDMSQAIEAVKNCVKFDIEPNIYFMAGNITETKENVRKSIEFARKLYGLGANPIWAWGVSIYPGTELEFISKQQNILPSSFSWTELYYHEKNLILGRSPYIPIVENPTLKIEELAELNNTYNEYMLGPFKSLIKILPNRLKKIKKLSYMHRKLLHLMGYHHSF
ncbi:MAG: radical SAM protein [Candidatus Methanoperedens sp.]|nr:radical SAM protein [Candidatus Methanoperedens sp.]